MSASPLPWQYQYRQLPKVLYQNVQPTPMPDPQIVAWNNDLAKIWGVSRETVLTWVRQKNAVPQAFSQAYAGHQYGHFTMLGDGRAVVLGEWVHADGTRMDVQLKGSGPTPFSRQGDGRAALGPMLREFLISEAMHALGIPTTRSLAVIRTGETIMRQDAMPGAILVRMARSHIRVGTLQFAACQQDPTVLKSLLAHTIQRENPTPATLATWLDTCCARMTTLISHWMRVGFVHGVMNTDNVSLSHETLDYGPCAFLDTYHPDTVFSSIDRHGRYAYGQQSVIGQWNMARLLEVLLPQLHDDPTEAQTMAHQYLQQWQRQYQNTWRTMMANKLGIVDPKPEDNTLIQDLLQWMQTQQADFTETFCDLMSEKSLAIRPCYADPAFQDWHERWQQRLPCMQTAMACMRQHNPQVIPRNHQVAQALMAADQDDFEPFERLYHALQAPYTADPNIAWLQKPPQPHERITETFCGT